MKAAIDIQRQLRDEPEVPLRIGLHLGEIFFEDEKVMGDSINVASRIQSLGQANTILFSKEIFDKIKNQPGFNYVYLASADIQKAIDYLEESYKIHTLYMLFLKIEPIFDQIRNEPALKPY